jgi:hypothetical protein
MRGRQVGLHVYYDEGVFEQGHGSISLKKAVLLLGREKSQMTVMKLSTGAASISHSEVIRIVALRLRRKVLCRQTVKKGKSAKI